MKNILIIGASSGIGLSLAQILNEEGHNVYGTYFKNELSSKGISYQYLDVLSPNIDLKEIPNTLDGLVYCPGSIDLKPFHRIKAEDFLKDHELQFIGAVKCIQSLLPNLKRSKRSSIVLFSTVAVQSGFMFHAQVAASKGAIEGLTRSLAAEFAPRIRVNAIAPSLTNTPLAERLLNSPEKLEANQKRHPLKRIGESQDIANTASFLLSDRSDWMTGQILHVDGGMSSIRS